MMKKARYIFPYFLALTSTCLFGQDLCTILDSAYIEFDQNFYPEIPKIFIKNWTLYKEDGYAIEQNQESFEFKFVENDIIWDGSKFIMQAWHMPFAASKIQIIDTPSFFFVGDTLCVQNRGMQSDGQYFCYGDSFISVFVFNRNNGVWEHKTGYMPLLNFKFPDSFDEIISECIRKVINELKANNDQNESFLLISDYLSRITYATELYGCRIVPHGYIEKVYRSKVKYFIGYPQISLKGKVMTVSFRVIKSKSMRKSIDLTKSRVVSCSFDLEKSTSIE